MKNVKLNRYFGYAEDSELLKARKPLIINQNVCDQIFVQIYQFCYENAFTEKSC